MTAFVVGQTVRVVAQDAPHAGGVAAVIAVDDGWDIPFYELARFGWFHGGELVAHVVAEQAPVAPAAEAAGPAEPARTRLLESLAQAVVNVTSHGVAGTAVAL